MTITTVIPTFQRPKLLSRSIESALSQEYQDIVVVVYDNDSQDETGDVVNGFMKRDSRVSYVPRPRNIGAFANMADGVRRVQTEFYSLLNDDDFLLPSFYRKAMAAFESHPDSMFVCTSTVSVDLVEQKFQVRNADWKSGTYLPSPVAAAQMMRSHFTLPSVLMRRSLQDLIGPFDPSGDDMLYLAMAASAAPFTVVGTVGASYTIHQSSFSRTVGLRQNPAQEVYGNLLTTIDRIVRLPLSEERRLHLLIVILRHYLQTFHARNLKSYQSKQDATERLELPSLLTSSALLARLLSQTPVGLQPHLAKFAQVLARGLSKLKPGHSTNWTDLPIAMLEAMNSERHDIASFAEMIECAAQANEAS